MLAPRDEVVLLSRNQQNRRADGAQQRGAARAEESRLGTAQRGAQHDEIVAAVARGAADLRLRPRIGGRQARDRHAAAQVTEYRPVTITGEVKNPGRYKFTFGLDVRAAITMGGGYDKRANKDTVIVYRNNQPFEGQAQSVLEPGDTVEVARR